MLKKTLLKNTKEFLEKNFSENLFLSRKYNKKQKKLLLVKGTILNKKLLKLNLKNFKLLSQNSINFPEKYYKQSENLRQAFFIEKYNSFLTSMHVIKSYFEKRQTRNSCFKNKIKEKKKLSILYGNLSNKQIKKTLQQACKLRGNVGNNLLILLESRVDVILYRALFFPSIKSARQWINCNKILVNSKYINIASYKTNFGDIISIPPKKKKFIASNILKFFFSHNLYTLNDSRKIHNYKQNILFLNPQKKRIFNLLKKNSASKKKSLFFLLKNNFKIKKKLNANKLLNMYAWKTKLSFFTKNLVKALFFLKNKNVLNNNKIKNKMYYKILFKEKHKYIISNFYFILLQNQIKPINKFFLKQNINKLAKIFQINNLNFYTKKYQVLNKNNLLKKIISNNKIFSKAFFHVNNPINSIKWHFLFYKEKLNTKVEILLSNINKKIIQQTKEITNSLVNNKYVSNIEKKYYNNNLINLNYISYCDILFFLKLKTYFFKKREISFSHNLNLKINFKPLNLEISYKTLTIIHLFSPQKIIFPCSLDVELLHKSNI